MPGHRFFVELAADVAPTVGAEVALSAIDSHHARDVLRLRAGDEITVIVRSSGARFEAGISTVDPRVTAKLTALAAAERHPHSRVKQLLFALCKGERNDFVCEKLTELGVGTIHFFQSERSVVKLPTTADIQKKKLRFERIAETAAKQCDRNSIPSIMVSGSLEEALANSLFIHEDRKFFCSLNQETKEFRTVAPPRGFIHLTIGPEGDLTSAEEKLLLAQGFEAITLGPTVLRSDTAAIASAAMALGTWGYDP